MHRDSLLKKDQKGKLRNHKLIYNWRTFLNLLVLILALSVVSFFTVPYFSMHFMNNQASSINSTKVLFYSSDCEACESVYPVVFWDNVVHGTKVQTINLKVEDNKHFVDDDLIMSTPTIINFDNNKRIATTDKQAIKDFINN